MKTTIHCSLINELPNILKRTKKAILSASDNFTAFHTDRVWVDKSNTRSKNHYVVIPRSRCIDKIIRKAQTRGLSWPYPKWRPFSVDKTMKSCYFGPDIVQSYTMNRCFQFILLFRKTAFYGLHLKVAYSFYSEPKQTIYLASVKLK